MVGLRYQRKLRGTREASNGGRVRVRIIHGLNISHKELTYLLQKSTSHQNQVLRTCWRSGNGGPQTCLPAACGVARRRPNTAHHHQRKLKTLARGQASWGGRQEASSEAASSGRLARSRRDQGRAPREELVTQAMTIETRRAPACIVSFFPLWCKGGKHRPRYQAKVAIPVQQDQDQQSGRTEVTVEPKTASSPVLLAAEDHLWSG